jgi:hypothetical protein
VVARIAIDPNIRVRGNQTYAGIEDIEGDVGAGSHVVVYEPESGLSGPGEVTEVDRDRGLVYIVVDWSKLRLHPARSPLQVLWDHVRARVAPELARLRDRMRTGAGTHRTPGRSSR